MMEQTLARDGDELREEIARLLVQADAQRNAIEALRAERDRLQAEAMQTVEYLQAVNARLVECQAENATLAEKLAQYERGADDTVKALVARCQSNEKIIDAIQRERATLAEKLRAYEETAEHYCAADTPISADGIRGYVMGLEAKLRAAEAQIVSDEEYKRWLQDECNKAQDELAAFHQQVAEVMGRLREAIGCIEERAHQARGNASGGRPMKSATEACAWIDDQAKGILKGIDAALAELGLAKEGE